MDENTHKIRNICCIPFIYSCQRAEDSCQKADDGYVDWLDLFEDELLLLNLFETERCEGVKNCFNDHETFYEPSRDCSRLSEC